MHKTFEKHLLFMHKQCFHEPRAFIRCFTIVQSIISRVSGQKKKSR